MRRFSEVLEAFKRKGKRMTPQRIILAKIIMDNVKRHPSLKDLHDMAREMLPGTGISTVYNTIKMLEEEDFIKVFYHNGKLHIDMPHEHVNVACRDTGEIVDVPDGELARTIIKLLEERGMKVENPMILVVGDCGHLKAREA